MPMNDGFLAVVTELDKIDAIEDEQVRVAWQKSRNDAIDALLKADPTDNDGFREAISAHKDFWKTFDDLELDADVTDEYIESDDFLDPHDVDISFSGIHKLFAQKRVSLGLQFADKETLIGILSNNRDECRAYLASKPVLGKIDAIPGWPQNIPAGPGVPKEKNTSQEILSNEEIDRLKQETSKLLLAKLVGTCNDTQLLTGLLEAHRADAFNLAAKALLPPSAANATFSFGLDSLDDEEVLTELIEDRIGVLKNAAAKTGFETFVRELGQPGKQSILSQKALLEKDDGNFKAGLPEPLKTDLADSEIEWAKALLGERFLKAYLSTQNRANLIASLNAGTDLPKMITAIKTTLGNNHAYVDQAVNHDSLNLMRRSMAQGVVSQTAGTKNEFKLLRDLVYVKTLDGFKDKLKAFGITQVDWVSQADMNVIQQSARSRALEIQITNRTQLSADSHSKLFEAFKQLSPEQQLKIVTYSDEIHHIMRAQDLGSLKHYLGQTLPESVLREIVEENKRQVLFSSIHNSVVANKLAGMKPPIALDQTIIDAINQALLAAVNPNIDGKYVALVQAIKAQCPDVDVKTFYNSFGLSDDGSALAGSTAVPDAIKTQQNNNQFVLAAYNFTGTSPAMKQFFGSLMGVEKDLLSQERVAEIENAFRIAPTLPLFIKMAFPDRTPPLVDPEKTREEKLKERLTREYTSAVFNQIKSEHIKESLVSPNSTITNAAIHNISVQVKGIHDGQQSLTQSKRDEYKPLLDVNPIHLINPSFQGKIKNDAVQMKKEYSAKAEECNIAVDQFRRNKAIIERHLASLPPENVTHPDAATNTKIQELRSTLKAELAAVNENLQFFTQVQSKYAMILQQIDKAGTQRYEYSETGVQMRSVPIGTALPALSSNPVPTPTTTVQTRVGGPLNFLLKDRVQEGSINVFDVTHKSSPPTTPGSPPPPQISSVGRFTEQYSHLNQAGIVTGKNGEVTKVPAAKYELLQFPKEVRPGQQPGDLTEAKVKFAMLMATQIMANLEGPPTKDAPLTLSGQNEEEMAYLWMAFKAHGVQHIRVNSGTFNPDSQKGKLWGYVSGSMLDEVDQIFKHHVTHVTQMKTSLEGVNQEKFTSEARNKADKVMGIKGGLEALKEQAEKAIKDEGVAPEENRPTNPGSNI